MHFLPVIVLSLRLECWCYKLRLRFVIPVVCCPEVVWTKALLKTAEPELWLWAPYLLSDCLCGVKCESNQDADKSAETVCIYMLGKMLEILAVDKGKIYWAVFSVRFYFAEEKVYCMKHHVHLIISKASSAFTWSFSPEVMHHLPQANF